MPILRLPLAGELQGALADRFGDGLIGGNGGETFGLGLALGTQIADQTQRFTLRQGSGTSEFRIGRRAASVVIAAIQSANCEL